METTTTNEVAVVNADVSAPIVWSVQKKGGDVVVKQAHCATSQVFAPKAARLAAGRAKDLAQLLSGCYRPVLQSVSEKMTDREKVKMFEAGVSVSRDKPSKTDMVPFASTVAAMWANAKGEKLAIASMLAEYVKTVTESV